MVAKAPDEHYEQYRENLDFLEILWIAAQMSSPKFIRFGVQMFVDFNGFSVKFFDDDDSSSASRMLIYREKDLKNILPAAFTRTVHEATQKNPTDEKFEYLDVTSKSCTLKTLDPQSLGFNLTKNLFVKALKTICKYWDNSSDSGSDDSIPDSQTDSDSDSESCSSESDTDSSDSESDSSDSESDDDDEEEESDD